MIRDSGADAAWAAADTLHAAARAMAAGCCGARPTGMTGPHGRRTARYPAGLATATNCGPSRRLLAMTSSGSEGVARVGNLPRTWSRW